MWRAASSISSNSLVIKKTHSFNCYVTLSYRDSPPHSCSTSSGSMTGSAGSSTSSSSLRQSILKGNVFYHHITARNLKKTRQLTSGDRHRIRTIDHDVFVDRDGRGQRDGPSLRKSNGLPSNRISHELP